MRWWAGTSRLALLRVRVAVKGVGSKQAHWQIGTRSSRTCLGRYLPRQMQMPDEGKSATQDGTHGGGRGVESIRIF